MASFVPPLMDPANPDAIANWAREVADLLNGQISIGEPLATLADGTGGVDTLRPNGVKGHTLGSFVHHTCDGKTGTFTFVHNLNIEPKGMSAPTLHNDPLNVMWTIMRATNAGGIAPTGSGIYLDFHDGYAVTANSIELEWHIGGHNVVGAQAMDIVIWFIPTTR